MDAIQRAPEGAEGAVQVGAGLHVMEGVRQTVQVDAAPHAGLTAQDAAALAVVVVNMGVMAAVEDAKATAQDVLGTVPDVMGVQDVEIQTGLLALVVLHVKEDAPLIVVLPAETDVHHVQMSVMVSAKDAKDVLILVLGVVDAVDAAEDATMDVEIRAQEDAVDRAQVAEAVQVAEAAVEIVQAIVTQLAVEDAMDAQVAKVVIQHAQEAADLDVKQDAVLHAQADAELLVEDVQDAQDAREHVQVRVEVPVV